MFKINHFWVVYLFIERLIFWSLVICSRSGSLDFNVRASERDRKPNRAQASSEREIDCSWQPWYVFSEKRFYAFNATSKKGKTYRCHNRSCKSRIILQPDNLCVKLCTAHEHSSEKDCEKDFKKLSAIQAMKLKCIDIGSVASGKRMTAARSIYKDVIAQPE